MKTSTTSPRPNSSPAKAIITAAEPQLLVSDIRRSCDYFCHQLGFSLVFSYGSPPSYAQVARDSARLNLRFVDKPVMDSTVRTREELLAASMTVATADEIQLLFHEPVSWRLIPPDTKEAALGR